jgi:hypothetical protein
MRAGMIDRIFLVALVAAVTGVTQPAFADTTIKSEDGSVQITVPNGWREGKPVAPSIKIQAHSARGALVLVRVVAKEDFKDLKSLANIGLERFKKNMPDAEPKVEDIQINNKPAIRITLEGTQANGQRRGILLTFFEADANYVDVVTMANASVFKAEEPVLAGLAGQVKILTTPDSAAAAPASTPAAAAAPANPPAAAAGKPPAARAPR